MKGIADIAVLKYLGRDFVHNVQLLISLLSAQSSGSKDEP
jgi:hypothetical protein